MQKIIEFEDKVALYHNSNIPDINKVNDTDMNEIKSIVNGSLQGTNAMGSIVVDDVNCKNMFGVNSMAIRSGVTSIYNGSTLTLNGTSTGEDFNEDYTLKMVRLPAGTYTFTIQAISGTKTGSQSLVIRNIDNNSSILDTNFTGNYAYTFTLNQDTNINVLIYYLASGNVFTNYVMNIQLEKGSVATPYTPYKKIIKEENGYVKENTTFYANDFKCKNLFDYNSSKFGYVLGGSGAESTASGFLISDYIPVTPNTTYTISRVFNNVSGAENSMRVGCYQQNKTFIDRPASSDNPYTITTPSNCYYVRLSYQYQSQGQNSNDKVQLEIGSEVTPYTPYKNFDNTKVVLYSNTSGSTASSIDMNDDITKYTYIDVFYKSDGIWNMTRVYVIQGVAFELNGIAGTSTSIWEKFSIYQIATNKLNLLHSWKRDTNISANTFVTAYSNSSSYITITEVIAYK